LRATGDIIAFSSSDERLKDNKKNISNALEIVNNLNGITFDWNEKSGKTGRDYGVIAQEVQEVVPEAVTIAPFDLISDVSRSGEFRGS
jgi:hypothetical protein